MDFPGGPLVKTLCFQCKGRKLDPWLGNCRGMWQKQKHKRNMCDADECTAGKLIGKAGGDIEVHGFSLFFKIFFFFDMDHFFFLSLY